MNLDNSFESSQASEMFDETPLKENKKTKKVSVEMEKKMLKL